MKPSAAYLPRYRLGDIAKELGISLTTVSRALSGRGRVGEATRARILDCVQRLDESARVKIPHPIAKRTIGLFTPWYSVGHGMQTGVSTVAIETLRMTCEPKGYGVIFSSFGNPRQPTLGDDLLQSGSLAGVVLFRTKDESQLASTLVNRNVPYMFVYRNLDGTGLNYVGIEYQEAIDLSVKHCLETGYTEIGLLSGDTSYPSHRAYRQAFVAGLEAHRLRRNDAWIQQQELTEEGGYVVAKRLLRGSSAPRALVCCSDRLAFGVLRAAADLRKRVPKDLAVISIDGTPQCAFTTPTLTVIRIPWAEMFSVAAKLLLDIIEGGAGIRQVAAKLRCELIVRESTAAGRPALSPVRTA